MQLRFLPQPSPESSGFSVDKISITRKSYDGKADEGYRTWTVIVAINDERGVPRSLRDPFIDTEYGEYINPHEGITLCNECSKDYFDDLVLQLGLDDTVCRGRPYRQISIHEELNTGLENERNPTSEPSIYSLFWEVLENVHFWKPCALTRVRLCRTWTFDGAETGVITQQARQPSLLPAQKAECRILLVIARSFRRDKDNAYRDYRPGLVLGPLLKIALWCKQWGHLPRVHLHVVRPGTIDELESELKRHGKQGFDIVHLDMHGKINIAPSSIDPLSEEATPYLRFARNYNGKLGPFPDKEDPIEALMGSDNSLHDIAVNKVAELLREHGVTKIALSACLSSYAQLDMLANMCHIFLSHGASHVSAMSFQVRGDTAQIYYAAFYEALLVNGQSFLSAAAVGRETLRTVPGQIANALVPTNYHRATRVSTNDFWPKHRLRLAWIRHVAARCLLMGVIMVVTSIFLLYCTPASWLESLAGRICSVLFGGSSLLSIIWYGLIRWVQQLPFSLWLWTPTPIKIFDSFDPDDKPWQMSDHVDIEHLVLEDRLAFGDDSGAVYLWSDDANVALGGVVTGLARVWVSTGFVDSIDIIPAMVFTSSLSGLQWWLRLWTSRHRSNTTGHKSPRRKRLVIITDFDKFYEFYRRRARQITRSFVSDAALPGLQDGLGRMTTFVSSYSANLAAPDTMENSLEEIDLETVIDEEDIGNGAAEDKTYLIITGSLKDFEWLELPFEPDVAEAISRAVPHLHEIQPSQ